MFKNISHLLNYFQIYPYDKSIYEKKFPYKYKTQFQHYFNLCLQTCKKKIYYA
jgi:hypothetical protein